jgi:class 3 adenylate cyclase
MALRLTSDSAIPPPAAARDAGGRWRTLVRRGLPVAGVFIVTALVAAIGAYVHESNRRGAVSLSNDLVDAIDRRIAVQLHAYLSPSEQFLELARQVGGARDVFAGAEVVEPFALKALPGITTITGFSYADPDGSFLFVVRNAQGGYDTKLIDRRAGGHRVTWTRRDASGSVVGTSEDPADSYDPRQRPWYTGAVAARGHYWTDTYLFFTLRTPGITHASPHYDSTGALRAVYAVDLELASLCAFLRQLEIGVSGRAIVVDPEGRVVAYPGDDWLPADRPNVTAPRLDEMNDPVLARTFNRLRVEGYGRKILDFGDRRIIVSSEPLKKLTGRDWVILIVVPESDFVGFVASSGWVALALSALVVLIVAGLAALLAWRGLQAERRAQAATVRQRVLESHARTFAELARTPAVLDRAKADGLREALESAAATVNAKRVSVWRLDAGARTLRCEDCFDREAGAHTAGLELHRTELPNLFATLAKGEAVDTTQAEGDRRTAELSAIYLGPLGSESVLVAPISAAGQPVGMLMVEEPPRGDEGAGLGEFCAALACLFALRLAPEPGQPAAETGGPAIRVPAAKAPAAEAAFAARSTSLKSALMRRDSSLDQLGDGRIERAAVAVIKLPDWLSTAQRANGSDSGTTMDAILAEVRQVVERSGIAYAALMDDQIVLAALSAPPASVEEDARRTALAALDLRDTLLQLENTLGVTLGFRLAIDIGPVMVGDVGGEAAARNVWGGAVGVAKVLAAAAGRHTISASETTYEVLSGDFLFRPRGQYFLPETGTMRTFVLVGEI